MSRLVSRLLLLAIVVAVKAIVVDRLLGLWRAGASPAPLRMVEVIDAPIERTWEVLADVPLQVEWMSEMTSLVLETPGPVRVGTRGTATVRILGISVTDPVEVTVVDPPTTYAIRHEGLVKGGGVITLEPGADGSTTVVRWAETLIPPVLPNLGALLMAPVLRSIFQADLRRFKVLVESGGID